MLGGFRSVREAEYYVITIEGKGGARGQGWKECGEGDQDPSVKDGML